jgi:hypothetical protein
VCVRVRLDGGVAEIAVSRGAGPVEARRISRLGEGLVILPIGPAGGEARLTIRSGGAGPTDVEVRDVRVGRVRPDLASASAALVAHDFEIETGHLADAADDNLIANADFAADDEVRGTPADWFAYVDTDVDAASRVLSARGTAPDGRPLLATGPVRVRPGRRYRATVRIAVDAGAVVARVVDYDECVTVAETEPLGPGGPTGDATLEFVAPAHTHAVRLRLDPVQRGEAAALRLTAAQLELLPALSESERRR